MVKEQRRCSRPGCEDRHLPTGPSILTHIGAHILHDPALKYAVDPCGFCGSSDGGCYVRLKKGRGRNGAWSVDTDNSRCRGGNLYSIQLASASKYNSTNPSTNVPVLCPVCSPEKRFVWKYNLKAHFKRTHTDDDSKKHRELWDISPEEESAMKNILSKGTSARPPIREVLMCSDAHSIRFSMR